MKLIDQYQNTKKTITIKDVEEGGGEDSENPSQECIYKRQKYQFRAGFKACCVWPGQGHSSTFKRDQIITGRSKRTRKPIGNYLFSGPTGVGKTEVARQLSMVLGVELIRFDMSEYMERHSVSRLIGAPPGYVGFDQGGLLTDSIDQHPHCVLLLDEIEKAHPDLFNILLQVMDHGKMTDHNGKTVDFRNVILIMTTNAGASDLAKEAVGFGRTERSGDDTEAINRMFSPEFRNRLDAIIPFAGLSKEIISRVVEKIYHRKWRYS